MRSSSSSGRVEIASSRGDGLSADGGEEGGVSWGFAIEEDVDDEGDDDEKARVSSRERTPFVGVSVSLRLRILFLRGVVVFALFGSPDRFFGVPW